MQELFAKLLQALAATGANSPEVQQYLAEIEANFKDKAGWARAMVDGARIGEGDQPISSPPAPSWLSARFLVPLLGGLSVGGGTVAGILKLAHDGLDGFALPTVTSQWVLVLIVAVLGALVGLTHAFFRNGPTLILPTINWKGGRISVQSFGFLRNMFMASLVAVATTWMAFFHVSVADTPDKAGPNAGPPAANQSLLTWNVLLSTLVAGIVGSRMASGQVELKTVLQALAITAEAPAVPGLGKRILNAKTPLEAVALATGAPPPRPPATEPASRTVETEAQLRSLLTKPVGKDVNGLTLEFLKGFDSLTPTIKTLLKDSQIKDVAAMKLEDFTAEAQGRGIDANATKALLAELHSQATRVMELLGSFPTTGTLSSNGPQSSSVQGEANSPSHSDGRMGPNYLGGPIKETLVTMTTRMTQWLVFGTLLAGLFAAAVATWKVVVADPTHLTDLFQAAAWPAVSCVALLAFRVPIGQFLAGFSQRVKKLSIFKVDIELTEAKEAKIPAFDELKSSEAIHVCDSSAHIFAQLQGESPADYVVIDLGDGSEWLSSRLFIVASLFEQTRGVRCMVFTDGTGENAGRFIGTASLHAVRSLLSRKYPWYEVALAKAFTATFGEPATLNSGTQLTSSAANIAQTFIRALQAKPAQAADGWLLIDNAPEVWERAEWLTQPKLRELLGKNLNDSLVKDVRSLQRQQQARSVLACSGQFVGGLSSGKFYELFDRFDLLEKLARYAADCDDESTRSS
jgi:hypothetical protein